MVHVIPFNLVLNSMISQICAQLLEDGTHHRRGGTHALFSVNETPLVFVIFSDVRL